MKYIIGFILFFCICEAHAQPDPAPRHYYMNASIFINIDCNTRIDSNTRISRVSTPPNTNISDYKSLLIHNYAISYVENHLGLYSKIFCICRIRLLKGVKPHQDTMSIIIKNAISLNSRDIDSLGLPTHKNYSGYYLNCIPFRKGTYIINLPLQDSLSIKTKPIALQLYEEIYPLKIINGKKVWNITPENWEKLRVKN